MDFFHDFLQAVLKFPAGVMGLKLPHVADPPDVVADPVFIYIFGVKFSTAYSFAQRNCLEYRNIGKPTPSDIIDLTSAWIFKEMVKRVHQIMGMNIITYLFALVTINTIFTTG